MFSADMGTMNRHVLSFCRAFLPFCTGGTCARSAARSPYGKTDRRDPLFLRRPEMADRYWVNTESMTATHRVLAVPLPKQCAFTYADSYTKNQMSESEVQQLALSSCNRRLADLGPLGENYGVP